MNNNNNNNNNNDNNNDDNDVDCNIIVIVIAQCTIYTSTKCDLEETGVSISKGYSNKNNFQ